MADTYQAELDAILASESMIQDEDSHKYSYMTDEHETITIQEKNVNIGDIGKILKGESNSTMLTFAIDRFYDGVDLYGKSITIICERLGLLKKDCFTEDVTNIEYSSSTLKFSWVLSEKVTYKAGIISAAVQFTGRDETGKIYALKTSPFALMVEDTLDGTDMDITVSNDWFTSIESRLNTLENAAGLGDAQIITDYTQLTNLPMINGIKVTSAKSLDDYGIAAKNHSHNEYANRTHTHSNYTTTDKVEEIISENSQVYVGKTLPDNAEDSSYSIFITEEDDENVEDFATAVNNQVTAYLAEKYVTPEMFGAKGDGITDDTQAIQQALDTGKEVKFSNKTYCVLNLVINKSVRLIGDTGATIKRLPIAFADYDNGNLSDWSKRDVTNLLGTGQVNSISQVVDDVYIENIIFDGNRDNLVGYTWTTSGTWHNLFMVNINKFTIKNCSVINSVQDGLQLTAISNSLVSKCHFINCGSKNENDTVSGTRNAITVVPYYRQYNHLTEDSCTIEHCIFDNPADESIMWGGTNTHITNCKFLRQNQYSIESIVDPNYLNHDAYITIDNCYAEGVADCFVNIAFKGEVDNSDKKISVTVSNNMVVNFGDTSWVTFNADRTKYQRAMVVIQDARTARNSLAIIKGNTFIANDNSGLAIDGNIINFGSATSYSNLTEINASNDGIFSNNVIHQADMSIKQYYSAIIGATNNLCIKNNELLYSNTGYAMTIKGAKCTIVRNTVRTNKTPILINGIMENLIIKDNYIDANFDGGTSVVYVCAIASSMTVDKLYYKNNITSGVTQLIKSTDIITTVDSDLS